MPTTIKNVRFSYAHVFKPKAISEDQKAKYSASLLISKKDEKTIKKIESEIENAKKEHKDKWGGKIPGNLKSPLRDGDTDRPDDESYAGHYFINANKDPDHGKPIVVDKDLNEIMDTTEFYSGCYGNASLSFFGYNTSGNKGVGCGLEGVQKTRDGEPLSGVTLNKEEMFDVEDEDDDFLS